MKSKKKTLKVNGRVVKDLGQFQDGDCSKPMQAVLDTKWTFGPAIYAHSHRGKPGASLDWYGDRLQVLVETEHNDELLMVRFNPNGTVAEIFVSPELRDVPIIRSYDQEDTEWDNARHRVLEKIEKARRRKEKHARNRTAT